MIAGNSQGESRRLIQLRKFLGFYWWFVWMFP